MIWALFAVAWCWPRLHPNSQEALLDILHALTEEAAEAALGLKTQARRLETELLGIEKRKAEIEAKLEAARRAQQRLLDYHPRIGRGYRNEDMSAVPVARCTARVQASSRA